MWLPESEKIVRTIDVKFLPETDSKTYARHEVQPSLTTDGATGREDATTDNSGPAGPIEVPTVSNEPAYQDAPAEPAPPVLASMPPPAPVHETPRKTAPRPETPRKQTPQIAPMAPSPAKSTPVKRRLDSVVIPPNSIRKIKPFCPSGKHMFLPQVPIQT